MTRSGLFRTLRANNLMLCIDKPAWLPLQYGLGRGFRYKIWVYSFIFPLRGFGYLGKIPTYDIILFLDVIASPSTCPCQSVGESAGQ